MGLGWDMGLGWAYGIWDWDGLMGFGMGGNGIDREWDFREWDMGGKYMYKTLV